MIASDDPVPDLPRLTHKLPVVVVDAKSPVMLELVGRTGWISRHRSTMQAPFVVIDGDERARRFAVDDPRFPGGHAALIVEPANR